MFLTLMFYAQIIMMLFSYLLYFLVTHPRVFIVVGCVILLPLTIAGTVIYYTFKDEKKE
jgi:energy-coupling factor transporter transmembrane protein EcfT